MAPKLTKLTAEQEAKLAEYRARWLQIGLSTKPTDRKGAEAAVADAYRAAKLPPPRIIIWLSSPMAGAVGAAMLAKFASVSRAQFRDPVGAQVWDQVGDQVGAQVGDQVGRAAYGLHDANWLGFYEFFWRECGFDCVAPLKGLIDHAQCGGWWWPFAGAVILTERPTFLARDAQNRLHCESDAAIRYSDGWGVFAWHGMRVAADIIEHPEAITLARIESERNAELKRVLIERYSLGRYVRDAGFEVLDADIDGEGMPRRLLQRDDLLVIELTNSTADSDESKLDVRIDDYIAKKMVANPREKTRRVYHVPCHPELRPMRADGTLGEPQKMTALNAVASTYGYRGEEYKLARET